MNDTHHRQLLILWEGAGWADLHPLIDSGKMPNLEKLANGGTLGKLDSVQPLGSITGPVSLASGLAPHQHRIFNRLTAESGQGPLREVIGSDWSPLWNQLSAHGDRCLSYGWPLTHPADPRLHTSISDRFPWPARRAQHRLTVPTDSLHAPAEQLKKLGQARLLATELDPEILANFLGTTPDQLPTDAPLDRIREALAADLTIHAAALTGIAQDDWDFVAIAFNSLCRLLPPSRNKASPYPIKEATYRFLDLLLGVTLANLPEDIIVHLVSSQSFPDGRNQRPEPAANGIWLLHGPTVKKDHLFHDGHVLEVAPTILALRGESPDEAHLRSARSDLFDHMPEVTSRTGQLPAQSTSPSAPWDHLLHDGRQRDALTPATRRNLPSITHHWKAAHYGEFRSLQALGGINATCQKGAELRKLFPHDLSFGLIYAHCLVENKHWKEIAPLLDALREEKPKPKEAIELDLFECALLQHQGDESALRKKLPAPETQNSAHTPFQWLKVAAFYRGLRDFQEALAIYHRLTEVHPNWTQPWRLAARINLAIGDRKQASQIALNLLSRDASDPQAQELLAEVNRAG